MTSKPTSSILAFLRNLPKNYQVMMSASSLLVVCSITLFALAIPPALNAQPGGLFHGTLFGIANDESSIESAQANNGAAAPADGTGFGGISVASGGIAPIGAGSLGGVIAAAGAAVSDDAQAMAQGSQGNQEASGSPADQTSQGSQPQDPYVQLDPTKEELAAMSSELSEDFYDAQDHYVYLSNVTAGSPIFWTYAPGVDAPIHNWVDMQYAYDISHECISKAAAFEDKFNKKAYEYPTLSQQFGAINSAWGMLSRASYILIDFLDAACACPDPSTHSECFMGPVEGHIISVSEGGFTYYTLSELENARQFLNQTWQ